jgi:3-oxoacyl-[acyl-carrier-protein] synthase III
MTTYAHITGWGKYVPERVLTNLDLARMVDTNDEWIASRTGIHERHIATDGENNVKMASEASLQALEVAGLKPSQIDLIVVATSTPEQFFPATACLVQDAIGATKAGAFDLLAACSGFIFALNTAAQYIRSGSVENVLVVGVETLSRIVDWSDRSTCILFGDGAGAFVLQASSESGGLLSGVMRSDGSGGDLLSFKLNPRRFPGDDLEALSDIHPNIHPYLRMDGREVFRFATRVLGQVAQEAIQKAALTLNDISLVIPHQANQRIINAAMQYLNLPSERCFVNVDRYGNTSTASIPIATCEALAADKVKPGDNIVFVGFGAGLTWGAAVVQWTGPFPTRRKVYPTRYRALARIRSFFLRILRRIDAFIWGRNFPEE